MVWRNYVKESSKAKQATLEKYYPHNLPTFIKRENKKLNPPGAPFTDKMFKEMIKNCWWRIGSRGKGVTYETKPIYFTQLSRTRRVPLHETNPVV